MTENQTPSPWDKLDEALVGPYRKNAWLDSISWMHRYKYQGLLYLELTPEQLEEFRARFEAELQEVKRIPWDEAISDYLDQIRPEQ